MALTKVQAEVLEGLMLGDGHLSIGGRSVNPRLRINRASKDDEYAEWICSVFGRYCTEKALHRSNIFDVRYNRSYSRTSFSTRRTSDLRVAFRRWFSTGKKRVPPDLVLTPRTIAVWLADDGSLYRKKAGGKFVGLELKFNTSDFAFREVKQLVRLLNERYRGGFDWYGGYKGKRQYVIVTSTRPAKRLLRDIDRVFPPLERKSRVWRTEISIEPMVPDCPSCGADAVFKDGFYRYKKCKQRFACKACNYRWLKDSST